MKKVVLSILMAAACLIGMAAQNDAMIVYRNDGAINAFLKADIDSMRYSRIGLDSLEHREYMVQEVWTPDSVYRIPLAAIDSVSFVTPPTVYKNDVTRLEETLLEYITGCDSLTLKLKAATPAHLLPKAGDKLALRDGCEALPYGFSGIVTEVRNANGGIDVVCTQAYLEDLFDSFCSVSTMYGTGATDPMQVSASGQPDRIVVAPGVTNFNLGPYIIDVSRDFSQATSPDSDLALTGGTSAMLMIMPSFRVHSFLIMGEGQGTYFSCAITGNIDVESELSFYSGVELSHDMELPEVEVTIPYTFKLLNFYVVPGLFGRAGGKITSTIRDNRTFAIGMAYDYSSIGANLIQPSLGCRLVSSSRGIEGSLEGEIAFGAFLETGFNLLCRDLAKAYVRGELGWKLKGDFVLRNSEIDKAEKDTKFYERLKASSITYGPFASLTMGSSAFTSGISTTLGETEATYKKWDIVPTFSDTKISREGSSTSADASVNMSGDCLLPVTVGFKLFDDNKDVVANFSSSDKYTNQGGSLSHCFIGVDKDKKYTVYPKVKLFGFDILASPSAQLDKEEDEGLLTCPDNNHPHAIDLGLPSGTKWCCRNVGASSPEDYGGYYAWGETSEKSVYNEETYVYYISSTNELINIGDEISGTQYDVAHTNMGGVWCMPSYEQIKELIDCCTSEWIQLNGVDGMLVTGSNGGQIFLPAAGYHLRDDPSLAGDRCFYWSGSLYPSLRGYAYGLYGHFGVSIGWDCSGVCDGRPVRAVCQ